LPAVENRIVRTFEEDEAHAVGTGVEPARIEQLEVEPAQTRVLDRDERRTFCLGIVEEGESCFARPRGDRLRVWADPARDPDRAGDRLVDTLDIGAGAQSLPALLAQRIQDEGPLGLAQAEIFVAARGKPMQVAKQPVAGLRILAFSLPGNGDGGHGLISPPRRG
jgi:hypothetical protein